MRERSQRKRDSVVGSRGVTTRDDKGPNTVTCVITSASLHFRRFYFRRRTFRPTFGNLAPLLVISFHFSVISPHFWSFRLTVRVPPPAASGAASARAQCSWSHGGRHSRSHGGRPRSPPPWSASAPPLRLRRALPPPPRLYNNPSQ
eukprot:416799-Prorocentrum_minimum.AAC.1